MPNLYPSIKKSCFVSLYHLPSNKVLSLWQLVKIGPQTNTRTIPAENNGYFDSKALSRQHAEVWEENGMVRFYVYIYSWCFSYWALAGFRSSLMMLNVRMRLSLMAMGLTLKVLKANPTYSNPMISSYVPPYPTHKVLPAHPFNQEFGVDIAGKYNKSIIHHKVATRVLYIFSEQEAVIGTRAVHHQH